MDQWSVITNSLWLMALLRIHPAPAQASGRPRVTIALPTHDLSYDRSPYRKASPAACALPPTPIQGKTSRNGRRPLVVRLTSLTRRLSQVSDSDSRGIPSTSSLENNEACLATVKTLERENEALERQRGQSERLRGVESEKQKLLNDQNRWRQQLSERRAAQKMVLECSIPLFVGTSGFGALLVYQKVWIRPPRQLLYRQRQRLRIYGLLRRMDGIHSVTILILYLALIISRDFCSSN
ncbi:hypothetical protein BDQ94DRAFT_176000 [Aspergillus welwitschiae]|uniref:Uncharacterized protein n=1 Tax=Aspergillus welwitschiae TaxID=1341132 RepID=A0A3F3PJE4_9EURO|nr:hypothetical protein BDQ94DRAFT_176000 [Aspergillus welwitschiae]RDH27008.1 hypothetical protein BDQ94DRAFT_176000 [Aspergillus welwitschiae]